MILKASELQTLLPDGKLRCELCPRHCRLRDGQRGMCFIRERRGDQIVLSAFGMASGVCVDPIEKKPLYHFLPGTNVLSFGTIGCNMTCKYCQNWRISKTVNMRDPSKVLATPASPEELALTAKKLNCPCVAFTYNEPIIFYEYALETAKRCHDLGIYTMAITAGYISERARPSFFGSMDAANVDLKGFRDSFYHRMCSANLKVVLDTLVFIKSRTKTWLEITNLVIPGENDDDQVITDMCRWIIRELGANVPLHFSAFFPHYKLSSHRPTTLPMLQRARSIALAEGLNFVYIGNVSSDEGSTTYCPSCHSSLIVRQNYHISSYKLTVGGCCPKCNIPVAGFFH